MHRPVHLRRRAVVQREAVRRTTLPFFARQIAPSHVPQHTASTPVSNAKSTEANASGLEDMFRSRESVSKDSNSLDSSKQQGCESFLRHQQSGPLSIRKIQREESQAAVHLNHTHIYKNNIYTYISIEMSSSSERAHRKSRVWAPAISTHTDQS